MAETGPNESGAQIEPHVAAAVAVLLARLHDERALAAAIAAGTAADARPRVGASPVDFWSRAAMAPPPPGPVPLLRRC